jgi:hypothetical protein
MNRPYCSGPTERCVTRSPSWAWRGALYSAAPPGIGDRQRLGGGALDDRDELDECRAQVIPQERVYLAAMVAVDRVDGGQHVPVDFVPPQHVQSAHHPVMGGLSSSSRVPLVWIVFRIR